MQFWNIFFEKFLLKTVFYETFENLRRKPKNQLHLVE